MTTLLVAVGSFFGFILAYHTYGRWLARRIFNLDPQAPVPSKQLYDDRDFVPTRKEIIFGHHFTSIAGTGPIVGPAIAVFWGWLPALIWVLLGSIFIGAVHDFGALVVSLRNRGQTVGEVAGRIIAPRARVLFLLILFFALTIVLAIFGLVIAAIFAMYPESVLSVWIEIPLAVAIGLWLHRKGHSLLVPSLLALGVMYLCMYLGAYFPALQILIPTSWGSPVVVWTIILLIYCFIASVLPVWTLLQPRDYINSHELVVALGLLLLGVVVATTVGGAVDPATVDINSAPAVNRDVPPDAPPIWPFLFITIACGAVSGFHCLVSSGTSSKQIENEQDAQYVGYGAMLLEGALAVIVILACCAGVGMGKIEKNGGDYSHKQVAAADSQAGAAAAATATTATAATTVRGKDAWRQYYPRSRPKLGADYEQSVANTKTEQIFANAMLGAGAAPVATTFSGIVEPKAQPLMLGGWGSHTLKQKVQAFVEGGANFLAALAIPLKMGICIIAVLVASFAATTLDTATRLQRYVVQELAANFRIKPLTDKYAATAFALVVGGAMAMMPGPTGAAGTGGLILWPLFGATNQLLAGLAFMVTVFYLWRRSKPIFFALIPMLLMLLMPAWAMLWNMFDPEVGWLAQEKYLLFGIGLAVMALQIWMVVEAILVWPKARGVMEETLPPLSARPELEPAMASGRSC